ncbi:hypothetical protein BGX28_001764 [Mortierella sp. GBA30]|nr:hypothetical protein BGX28_001764 [Mortierella sp. GBA30]
MARATFQIPELLTHIAQFLSRSDLASASSVSRLWHDILDKELWHTLGPELDEVWTNKTFLNSLRKHSHVIRELDCPVVSAMNRLIPNCTRLIKFSPPQVDAMNMQKTGVLLSQNPDLEDLELICDKFTFQAADVMTLVDFVIPLKKLKRLTFEYNCADPRLLLKLVRDLPRLEYLKVEAWSREQLEYGSKGGWETEEDYLDEDEDEDEDDFDSEDDDDDDGNSTDGNIDKDKRYVKPDIDDRPSRYSLRSFHADGLPGMSWVIEIAKASPDLESLTIAGDVSALNLGLQLSPELVQWGMQLQKGCPRLAELQIRNFMIIDRPALQAFLSFGFPSLRRFTFYRSNMEEAEVLQIMSFLGPKTNYRETLEYILIEPRYEPGMKRTSRFILDLLTTFTKLQTVVLESCVIEAEDMIKRLRGMQKSGVIGGPWACKDLEHLHVSIRGPAKGWTRRSVVNEERDDRDEIRSRPDQTKHPWNKYELFDSVLQHLRSMPKLSLSNVRFCYPHH